MAPDKPDRRQVADQLFAAALALAQLGEDFDKLHGLQGAEGEALLLILGAARHAEPDGEAAPVTPGRLGAALRLPSASVTAVVDRLEQAGHVRRVRDTRDRRRVLLVPTAAARRSHDAYWRGLDDRVLAALEPFRPGELAAIGRFLQRVTSLAAGYRTD